MNYYGNAGNYVDVLRSQGPESLRGAFKEIQSLARRPSLDKPAGMKMQDAFLGALGTNPLDMTEDEVEELDEDKVISYIATMYTILNEIEEDEEDDDEWKLSANMSPDLRAAMGLPPSGEVMPSISDWKAPAFSGLGNSAPLMDRSDIRVEAKEHPSDRTTAALVDAAKRLRKPRRRRVPAGDAGAKDGAPSGADGKADVDGRAQSKGPAESSWAGGKSGPGDMGRGMAAPSGAEAKGGAYGGAEVKGAKGDEEEDEEEWDEDDDGEWEYYDDDDEEEGIRSNVNMDPALARMLGMDVPEMETDWKPPTFSGLDNSGRLV